MRRADLVRASVSSDSMRRRVFNHGGDGRQRDVGDRGAEVSHGNEAVAGMPVVVDNGRIQYGGALLEGRNKPDLVKPSSSPVVVDVGEGFEVGVTMAERVNGAAGEERDGEGGKAEDKVTAEAVQ